MKIALPLLALAGCLYDPPPLPIEDDLQIIPNNACALERDAYVACVLDGDTFDVEQCGEEVGERIRMLGVDAPEIEHPPEPADCYGDTSHDALIDLIEGERVLLTFDEECEGVFGRTLAYVWLVDAEYERIAGLPDVDEYTRSLPGETEPALMLNEWVISRGYAEVFPEEAFGALLYQDQLELAESDARSSGRGLWGACGDR